jgi:hypothetical protein
MSSQVQKAEESDNLTSLHPPHSLVPTRPTDLTSLSAFTSPPRLTLGRLYVTPDNLYKRARN